MQQRKKEQMGVVMLKGRQGNRHAHRSHHREDVVQSVRPHGKGLDRYGKT